MISYTETFFGFLYNFPNENGIEILEKRSNVHTLKGDYVN